MERHRAFSLSMTGSKKPGSKAWWIPNILKCAFAPHLAPSQPTTELKYHRLRQILLFCGLTGRTRCLIWSGGWQTYQEPELDAYPSCYRVVVDPNEAWFLTRDSGRDVYRFRVYVKGAPCSITTSRGQIS